MYKHLFETLLSVLSDMYPEVELLGHIVFLCLIVSDPPCCFPQQLCYFTFSPTVHKGHKGPSFSTSLSTLVIFCWFFLMVAANGCEVGLCLFFDSVTFSSVRSSYSDYSSMPLALASSGITWVRLVLYPTFVLFSPSVFNVFFSHVL